MGAQMHHAARRLFHSTILIVDCTLHSLSYRVPIVGSKQEAHLQDVTKDKLIEDLKVVAQDVEELLRATANQTGEKLAAARARAEQSLRAAKARLANAGDEVAARTRAAVDATDVYVRDNPWQAVGAAAGLGFMLGYLIGRR